MTGTSLDLNLSLSLSRTLLSVCANRAVLAFGRAVAFRVGHTVFSPPLLDSHVLREPILSQFLEISQRGPGTLASANRELYKAAVRFKIRTNLCFF